MVVNRHFQDVFIGFAFCLSKMIMKIFPAKCLLKSV